MVALLVNYEFAGMWIDAFVKTQKFILLIDQARFTRDGNVI